MATIWNITKQTHVCQYLSFAGPTYMNVVTDSSVTKNTYLNMFTALYLRHLFLSSCVETLKSNEICDLGNESKLNKQICFTVLVVSVMPHRGKCEVKCMPYHSTAKLK